MRTRQGGTSISIFAPLFAVADRLPKLAGRARSRSVGHASLRRTDQGKNNFEENSGQAVGQAV